MSRMNKLETLEQKRLRFSMLREKLRYLQKRYNLNEIELKQQKNRLQHHYRKHGNYDIDRVILIVNENVVKAKQERMKMKEEDRLEMDKQKRINLHIEELKLLGYKI